MVDAGLRKTYFQYFRTKGFFPIRIFGFLKQHQRQQHKALIEGSRESDYGSTRTCAHQSPENEDHFHNAHSAVGRNIDEENPSTMPHQDPFDDVGCSAHEDTDDVRKGAHRDPGDAPRIKKNPVID